MKKTMLLAIGLIMIVSLVIYAVDQEDVKTELKQTGACQTVDDGIHAAANGFVIEISQKGTTYVTIVLNDAAPDHIYAVYPRGSDDLIGTFTTNKEGNGVLHFSMAASRFITIQIWNYEKPAAVLLLEGKFICDCDPPCLPPCPNA